MSKGTKAICHWCHKERDGKWALLFDIPDENDKCKKMHICPTCLHTSVYGSMNDHQKVPLNYKLHRYCRTCRAQAVIDSDEDHPGPCNWEYELIKL